MRLLLVFVALLLFATPALAVPEVPYPHDDAGSGTDAGDFPEEATTVAAGVVHRGVVAGYAHGDSADVWAIPARAGDVVEVQATGDTVCFFLYPEGKSGPDYLSYTCSFGGVAFRGVSFDRPYFTVGTDPGFTAKIPADGTYYLIAGYFEPARYAFSYAVNGEAPRVETLDFVP